MKTIIHLAGAALGLVLTLTAGIAVAEEYISFGSFGGVEVAWRNHDQSDGSGGRYYEQLLRLTNNNSYAVDVKYSLVMECADGTSGSAIPWEGLDSLGAGKTHSGEMAGLWTRTCNGHGGDGKARSARATIRVTPRK